MKWQEAQRKLKKSGFRVFTDREFQGVTGATPSAAKFQLIRYTRKGLLTRLKRGLYAVSERMPSPWLVANQLYKPSYVSLASALSYYGLIPESVYSMTSVTTKTTREFEAADRLYLYRTIKREVFGGYRSVSIDGEPILMAEREKAVADYLYFVFIRKERLNERLDLRSLNKKRVVEFLKTFGQPSLMKWFRNDLQVPDRRIAR